MAIEPTWNLALAVVLLVALAVAGSLAAGLRVEKESVWAAVRAAVQLSAVSAIIVVAIQHLWSAALVVLVMFAIGVVTTGRRTGVLDRWPWVALAMASGVVPVLLIVFLTGTVPLEGVSLVPIAGIIVGNMMTGHTLVARRSFAVLRESVGQYEAALSLGLVRSEAIALIDPDSAREATFPNNDATRTVGLVTLPGAYIGVLLGGGSPLQAGAAQLLVLLGIMAGQILVVAVAHALITRAKLLPEDLRGVLHP